MSVTQRLRIAFPVVSLKRPLIRYSLVYLALPYAIFFAGWLKWYCALPAIILVGVPLAQYFRLAGQARDTTQENAPGAPELKLSHLVLVCIVALCLLGVSGIGGYGFQDSDWWKHNGVLKDLIERPWPVVYDLEGRDVPLVYYVAFYLPAALVGKVGGWTLANHALFLWSYAGLLLAGVWFIVLSRRVTAWSLLLFFAFSGLDVIGRLLVTPAIVTVMPRYAPLLRWDHIEQWAIGWQYSANVTLLFWVPNQALAGWISAGLLIDAVESSRPGHRLLPVALSSLWSPFVMLGLTPLLFADFLGERVAWRRRLAQYLTLSNLCSFLLLAVVGLFYGAKFYEASPLLTGKISHGFSLSAAQGSPNLLVTLLVIGLFCLLEFGLFSLLLFRNRRYWTRPERGLMIAAILSLAALPFYRYGQANDLVMRASIPALFVLALGIARALASHSLSRPARILLVLLLILGAATPMIECARHIHGMAIAGALVRVPAAEDVLSLWSLSEQRDSLLIPQYVGGIESPFFRFLSRSK